MSFGASLVTVKLVGLRSWQGHSFFKFIPLFQAYVSVTARAMSSFREYSQLPEVVYHAENDSRGDHGPALPPKPTHLRQPSAADFNPNPPASYLLPQQGPFPCCMCTRIIKTWKCVQCDDSFCDYCWPKQRPHLVCRFHYRLLNLRIQSVSSYAGIFCGRVFSWRVS